jgi:hypothetical protein
MSSRDLIFYVIPRLDLNVIPRLDLNVIPRLDLGIYLSQIIRRTCKDTVIDGPIGGEGSMCL